VEAGSVDVVIALEVFEHLTDPMAVGAHGPDWPYLSLAGGQHVTFGARRRARTSPPPSAWRHFRTDGVVVETPAPVVRPAALAL
jgi:hypothetical protein